jgi:hypothetical protein
MRLTLVTLVATGWLAADSWLFLAAGCGGQWTGIAARSWGRKREASPDNDEWFGRRVVAETQVVARIPDRGAVPLIDVGYDDPILWVGRPCKHTREGPTHPPPRAPGRTR